MASSYVRESSYLLEDEIPNPTQRFPEMQEPAKAQKQSPEHTVLERMHVLCFLGLCFPFSRPCSE